MIKRLSNVIIATRNLDEAVEAFRQLGMEPSEVHREARNGMLNALFRFGDTMFELAQPADPQNPLNRFLERRGEGLYMMELEVDNLAAEVGKLKGKGVELIEQKMQMPAGGEYGVAFIHPRHARGVLMMLHERR